MRRFKIEYSYDGSGFAGSQKQPNKRTVQGEIERVLRKIDPQPIALIPSGRTDSDVHAILQVAHFDVERKNIGSENFLYMFKRQLPRDIVVLSVEEVDDDFHARFHAKKKEYVYKIKSLQDEERSPFSARYYTYVNQKIDGESLQKALNMFVGTHDFTSFTVTPRHDKEGDNVRTIFAIDVLWNESERCFDIVIEGDGFLQYMIRIMVAFALDITAGKETTEKVNELFDSKDKKYVHSKLEPYGLYLKKITY